MKKARDGGLFAQATNIVRQTGFRLERNIVVHLVEPAACRRARAARTARTAAAAATARRTAASHAATAALGRFATAVAAVVTTAAARTATAAEHLHLVSDNFRRVALLAVLALVLARAQAAFDINRRALLQVFVHDLGQTAEERNAMPLGHFLEIAGLLVLVAVSGREPDVRDGVPARQITHFRIGAEIADENDLVDGCHVFLLLIPCRPE